MDNLFRFTLPLWNFFKGEKYAMRTIPVLAVNKSEGLKVEVRTSSGPQLKYNRDHFAILYTLEMWTVEFRFRINCYFRWAVSEIWSQVIVILSRNHPKTGPEHWNFLLCFCDVWGLKWSAKLYFSLCLWLLCGNAKSKKHFIWFRIVRSNVPQPFLA